MSEVFEGQWWLPSNKENQLNGKLTINFDSHSELTFTGSWAQIELAFPNIKELSWSNSINEYDIINGYAKSNSNDDVSICLQFCYFKRSDSSGLVKITFEIVNVIKTLNFNSSNDIRIHSLFVKYDFLSEWTNRTGFSIERQPKSKEFTARIDYNHPEKITLFQDDNFIVYLWFRANIPMIHRHGSMTLSESVFLNIEFLDKVSIERSKEIVQIVQDLFSFMIATPVGRKELEFRLFSKQELLENSHVNHTCQLIYPELINRKKKSIHPTEMMITLDSLLSKEQNVFLKWFDNYDKIAQVKRLYFDTFYNNYMSTETRFLNLTMALEIYHFRVINSTRGKNKPTLNERITELISNHAHITNHFEDDLELFVKKIVHTRNYYNHGGGDGSKLLIPTNELFDFNIKMRILLEVIILKDLGFTDKEIYIKINNVYRFSLIVDFP